MVFCSVYMSPEYMVHGRYSKKSDVFSFGVLVLKILSGKKNKKFCHPDHHLNLIGHISINNAVIDSI
jgi:serine/threonine protein kinase